MAHYHIDTDMGVDDGLALVVANLLLVQVRWISTVFGNVDVATATRNALIFRELLGRGSSWNILRGASCAPDKSQRDARHIHGEDGLGGATAALGSHLLQRVSSQVVPPIGGTGSPNIGPVVLVGLGPATNIPNLVSWYGSSAVERIVLMSGTFFDVGNIIPAAEFNAHCDPWTLRATLDLGIPVTLVPLDVCRKVQLERSSVAAFGSTDGSEIERLIVASHMRYMDFYRDWEGIDGCFPHDAVAVLAALAPERFFRLRGRVSVDCSEATRGQTTFESDSSSHVEIITGGKLKWVRETLDDLLHHRI
jgi:inosine-uridine nucleoside N-ribohydrolase